ncbi:YitT family protein [Ammoniphilus sp. 3BR4]|uniref:YitT family protein n=1 Tax=Ammoniphilus sp. 3BR4 TaxID=3158265 RepID=UPI00346652D1
MFLYRAQFISNRRSSRIPLYKSGIVLFFGALLVSIALELLLVKNHVIDGGFVGIAIMLSYLTDYKLGILLIILNLPFLLLGYNLLGKQFAFLSLYSLFLLAIGTFLLEPLPVLSQNPVIAVMAGGILLGIGVGIIIRYGGALDGTEVIAILISKKTRFSIGQCVMFFNLFILGSAGFVFGLDEAINSLAAYFVAFKTIDVILDY